MIFDKAPEDYIPTFEVAGCILRVGDTFLLLHRNKEKSEGAKWGVPGGKVDPGETHRAALVREIAEETGILILESQPMYHRRLQVRHDRHDFIYHLYSYRFVDGLTPPVLLNPNEHQAFAWATKDEALTYNLVGDVDECIRIVYA